MRPQGAFLDPLRDLRGRGGIRRMPEWGMCRGTRGQGPMEPFWLLLGEQK